MGMEETRCHLSNPLLNRANLKGAAYCKKRNKPSGAESHEHDIAHTNDFISPSAKHLSPKNCTHTGQIMEQRYLHTVKVCCYSGQICLLSEKGKKRRQAAGPHHHIAILLPC